MVSGTQLQDDREFVRGAGLDFQEVYKPGAKGQWYKADGTAIRGLLPTDSYGLKIYRAKGWTLKKPANPVPVQDIGPNPSGLQLPSLGAIAPRLVIEYLSVEGFEVPAGTLPDVAQVFLDDYRERYDVAAEEKARIDADAALLLATVPEEPIVIGISEEEQDILRRFREGALVDVPTEKKKRKQNGPSGWDIFTKETRQAYRDNGQKVPNMKTLAQMYRERNTPPVIASHSFQVGGSAPSEEL